MIEKVAIYGAGGHGRNIAWTIEAVNSIEKHFETICFIDDDERLHGSYINEIPIMDFEQIVLKEKEIKMICGIGDPNIRHQITEKIYAEGLTFVKLIYPNVQRTRWLEIGEGTLIGAGSVLSPNISIGRHVVIYFDCTLGHDVVVEDYASISSGVHLGGNVHVGKRAFLGLGTVVLNGSKDEPIIIGDDAIVGAGACVTKSIPAGITVAGIPAKPLFR